MKKRAKYSKQADPRLLKSRILLSMMDLVEFEKPDEFVFKNLKNIFKSYSHEKERVKIACKRAIYYLKNESFRRNKVTDEDIKRAKKHINSIAKSVWKKKK